MPQKKKKNKPKSEEEIYEISSTVNVLVCFVALKVNLQLDIMKQNKALIDTCFNK